MTKGQREVLCPEFPMTYLYLSFVSVLFRYVEGCSTKEQPDLLMNEKFTKVRVESWILVEKVTCGPSLGAEAQYRCYNAGVVNVHVSICSSVWFNLSFILSMTLFCRNSKLSQQQNMTWWWFSYDLYLYLKSQFQVNFDVVHPLVSLNNVRLKLTQYSSVM